MSSSAVEQLPKREEISEQYKWNLEDIFSGNEEWEEEFKRIQSLIPAIESYKGRLGDSGHMLYEALQQQDKITERFSRLFVYAHMRYDQNTNESLYQGMEDRARRLASQLGQATAFLVPEILTIPEKTIQAFYEEEPELRLYEHALDAINKERPHVLTESEEALLAQASEVMAVPGNTFGMLNNADLEFPSIKDENGNEAQVTHGRLLNFLESDSRRVREEAFKAVYSTYSRFKNTISSTLGGQVKKNTFNASIRKYRSAREAALSNNHIPEKVYDQLVSTVHDYLPLLHRYVKLRKQVLELDEIHNYDLYTPLVKDIDMKMTYEEAKETVLEALQPLGKEYTETIAGGFEKGWVDVYENVGKRSGAYSSGAYGTMPYILMNWQDSINNVYTLAHELGHSMHSYLTHQNQPYPYADYTIFVAEVASTVNEALLTRHLLAKTTNKTEKAYLLNQYLEGFRGTVFRQTMFAEFEQLIHEKAEAGEALTPDLLNSLYYELNEQYFGPHMTLDDDIALEWARIPHFYMNFYVYQYATGYSAAAALSQQITEEGEPAVERYLQFLKSGSSDYPIEVLKKAGVDMTTSTPIELAMKSFEDTLNELEELLLH